jgi:hypothetical protein
VAEYRGDAIMNRRDTSFRVNATLKEAGPYELVAVNPGGRTSRPFRIEAKNAPAAPAITGITPSALSRSSSPQTLTLKAQGSRGRPRWSPIRWPVQTLTSGEMLPPNCSRSRPLGMAGPYCS